jgi:hypothetical protein
MGLPHIHSNPRLAFALRPALRQLVGSAVHLQGVDLVGQTVAERADQTFLVERDGPRRIVGTIL